MSYKKRKLKGGDKSHPELFGEFLKDENCNGLYGQKVSLPADERAQIRFDKESDKREARFQVKKCQITFDEALSEPPVTDESLAKLIKNRSRRRNRMTLFQKNDNVCDLSEE